MKLERAVDSHRRHRIAGAIVLAGVMLAIPFAVAMRPLPDPAPCVSAWAVHHGRHVAILSAGPDGVWGTTDDIEACR